MQTMASGPMTLAVKSDPILSFSLGGFSFVAHLASSPSLEGDHYLVICQPADPAPGTRPPAIGLYTQASDLPRACADLFKQFMGYDYQVTMVTEAIAQVAWLTMRLGAVEAMVTPMPDRLEALASAMREWASKMQSGGNEHG